MSESGQGREPASYGPYEFRLGDELRGERATLGRSLLDIQRDLRIKAAYIAAIENCDPSVFPNPSFIAGYVRSYARYLNLDPDEVYWRFCQESGFAGAKGVSPVAERVAGRAGPVAGRGRKGRGVRPAAGEFFPAFPLAEGPARSMPSLPLSALGSLVVLIALIGGIGYGGWAVLQNIQRVQFAPVDEVPVAIAEAPPMPEPDGAAEPLLPELARPVAATALVDLYRQQELEVPILVPRDGPIAALDPDKVGLLASPRTGPPAAPAGEATPPPAGMVMGPALPPGEGAEAAAAASEPDGPRVTAEDARPLLTVIAERPAWIRVYFANGTILFEQILESGESYEVPPTAEAPLVWAGNSGSVYVKVGQSLHGPLGSGTRAVRDVPLDPEAIAGRFGVVDEVPRVISEALGELAQQAEATIVQ